MAALEDAADDDGPISSINIIPFVDIVLVLLVIFMLTSATIIRASLKVELPKAASAGSRVESTLNLVYSKTEQLTIDGQLVTSMRDAGAIVARQARANPKTQAVIAADKGWPTVGSSSSSIWSRRTASRPSRSTSSAVPRRPEPRARPARRDAKRDHNGNHRMTRASAKERATSAPGLPERRPLVLRKQAERREARRRMIARTRRAIAPEQRAHDPLAAPPSRPRGARGAGVAAAGRCGCDSPWRGHAGLHHRRSRAAAA